MKRIVLQGELEIDTSKGVIWFNNEKGCKLRICGVYEIKEKEIDDNTFIDITLKNDTYFLHLYDNNK